MLDGWTVPAPRPQNPAASAGWRIRHSWWLILPILGLGCLSGTGLIYVGLRARRPSWWVPGIGYLLLGWAGFIAVGTSPKESAVSDWAVGLWMAVWIAGIVHSCLINSSWLQWRANYIPWYAESNAPPPSWQAFPAPASPLPPSMVPPPGAYYAPGPSPYSPAAYEPPVAVEVNTATAEDFARLPGFDLDRAYRVIAERQNRSGFRSVDEFAFAAGLAPHQFAPLRPLLTCVPPPPPPPGPHQQGRALDV